MTHATAKPKRAFFFHPALLSIYPVAALLANNMDQLRPLTALRVAGVTLLAGLLLYGLLRLLLKKTGRAALLTSFWLVLFYTYGHVYQTIEGRALSGFVYGKHRFLVVVWALLLAAGTWLILRRLKSTRELNRVLNVVSLFLLLFPAAQIGWFEVRAQSLGSRSPAANATAVGGAAVSTGQAGDTAPDIYYIVLDGYSRADVMQKLYNLDVTPFYDELNSLGFIIPECAQSNYGLTAFSMSAALNMNYLEAFGSAIPIGSSASKIDYQAMRDYLSHSQVRQAVTQQGYQFITFETGYWWLDVTDSDKYIVENNNPLRQYSQAYSLSNFESLFIRTTAMRVVSEANAAWLAPLTKRVKTPEEQHYEWVKFALDQLDQIPSIPGKKFVYFHVLAPHDPFVFAPDGSYEFSDNTTSDIPGYPNEVRYLNERVVEIVRNLITQSKTPPVIIIQGDHGWDPRYRMQILNAYYLPYGGSQRVYPTITPVNTFRLVLNQYLGGQYDLLPDKSYFSFGSDFPQYGVKSLPYQFTEQPSTCLGQIK